MIGATTLGYVADAYFSPIPLLAAASGTDQTAGDEPVRFRSSPATAGPWAGHLQHGGPPNALAVAVAEQALRRETGRSDLVALRLAADFVRPVPVADLLLRTRIRRAARSAALVEVAVSTEVGGAERDCLLARVWFVALSGADAPAAGAPAAVPDVPPSDEVTFPYGESLEWRFTAGSMRAPGPAAAWVRPRIPLLDGQEMSSLSRAVLIADSASGISAELSWDDWSFVNVDLDVHLARPLSGAWVCMDAATQLGGQGAAVARSTLSDERGVAGGGLQTLVVAPTRRPAAGSE
jgi:acyl-coenzyme A thioesterase PaaI-like protein